MSEQQVQTEEDPYYLPRYSRLVSWFPYFVPDPEDKRLLEEVKDLEGQFQALEVKAFDRMNTLESEIRAVSSSVERAKGSWDDKLNMFDADRVHAELTDAQYKLSEYSKHLKEFTEECKRHLVSTEVGISKLQVSLQPKPKKKFSTQGAQTVEFDGARQKALVELVNGEIQLTGGKIRTTFKTDNLGKYFQTHANQRVRGKVTLVGGSIVGPEDKMEDMDDGILLLDGHLELATGTFQSKGDEVEITGGTVKLVDGRITLTDPRMTLLDNRVELVNQEMILDGEDVTLVSGSIKLVSSIVELHPPRDDQEKVASDCNLTNSFLTTNLTFST